MRNRAGAALMLALWLIVVLGTISSSVILKTRSTTAIAANYRARVVARYAAESGVTLAAALLEDSLASLATDLVARRAYLNDLDHGLRNRSQIALGDGRTLVALIDPAARLDVNHADEAALTTLLSYFTDAAEAASSAGAIRAWILGPGADSAMLTAARPLQSLEELARVPGLRPQLAAAAAEFLTVDGDGTINRVTASDTVLAAAAGELRDEPSRIVIVSRGWQDGHPLNHEIQAVYAINGNALTLIRWREREL